MSLFSLEKAFEKQIKTIKSQGQKQIDTIMNKKRPLNLINNDKENLFLKQKEMFIKLVEKRFDKTLELNLILWCNE